MVLGFCWALLLAKGLGLDGDQIWVLRLIFVCKSLEWIIWFVSSFFQYKVEFFKCKNIPQKMARAIHWAVKRGEGWLMSRHGSLRQRGWNGQLVSPDRCLLWTHRWIGQKNGTKEKFQRYHHNNGSGKPRSQSGLKGWSGSFWNMTGQITRW